MLIAFNDFRCIQKFDSLRGGKGRKLELFGSLPEFSWLASFFENLLPTD